jgi:hypothetical protein
LLLLRRFFDFLLNTSHIRVKRWIVLSDLTCSLLYLFYNRFTALVISRLLRFFERYSLNHASQL